MIYYKGSILTCLFEVLIFFPALLKRRTHNLSFTFSHILCPLTVLVELNFIILSVWAFEVCMLCLHSWSPLEIVWTAFIEMLVCLVVTVLHEWLVTYSQMSDSVCSSPVQLSVPNLFCCLTGTSVPNPNAFCSFCIKSWASIDLTAQRCSKEFAKPACPTRCLLSQWLPPDPRGHMELHSVSVFLFG